MKEVQRSVCGLDLDKLSTILYSNIDLLSNHGRITVPSVSSTYDKIWTTTLWVFQLLVNKIKWKTSGCWMGVTRKGEKQDKYMFLLQKNPEGTIILKTISESASKLWHFTETRGEKQLVLQRQENSLAILSTIYALCIFSNSFIYYLTLWGGNSQTLIAAWVWPYICMYKETTMTILIDFPKIVSLTLYFFFLRCASIGSFYFLTFSVLQQPLFILSHRLHCITRLAIWRGHIIYYTFKEAHCILSKVYILLCMLQSSQTIGAFFHLETYSLKRAEDSD